MNALIGVDLGSHWKKAVDLLRRLNFEGLNPTFANVVESVLPDGSFMDLPSNHPIAEIIRENEAEGMRLAEEAKARLGLGGTAVVLRGQPKEVLFNISEETGADLVALGSERKSVWGDLFFGSVAKALLTGSRCSVLYGKQEVKSDGPITAILATDHSDYSNRSADWFLKRHPQGIGKLVVLTAATMNPLVGKDVVQNVENMGDSIIASIMDGIRERNQMIADGFTAAGINCVAEVREGHPSVAIEAAMKEHNADLLVVGAQGRGFLERLRVGSTSFEQVVNSPYNVLVVRP
jgi:nucleotide-binding universal stress UspA family protein